MGPDHPKELAQAETGGGLPLLEDVAVISYKAKEPGHQDMVVIDCSVAGWRKTASTFLGSGDEDFARICSDFADKLERQSLSRGGLIYYDSAKYEHEQGGARLLRSMVQAGVSVQMPDAWQEKYLNEK